MIVKAEQISRGCAEEVANLVRRSRRIAVLTGAGVSQESGLATFRGNDVIWSRFKPEELANMTAFMANPERVWEWYQYRRDVLATAAPNKGHFALAEWEKRVDSFVVITQNVDGLHQMAGSTSVVELHGNLRTNRCMTCQIVSNDDIRFVNRIPTCRCGGRLRPDVVWFGEMLSEENLSLAENAARSCDLFMVVGTSAIVYPAASFPMIALERGVPTIEINIEPTPFTTYANYSIRQSSATVLPQLVQVLNTDSDES